MLTPLSPAQRKKIYAFFPYVQDTAGREQSKTGIQFGHLFEQRNAVATTNKADILRTSVSPFTPERASDEKVPTTKRIHAIHKAYAHPNVKDTHYHSDPCDADTELDSESCGKCCYSISTDRDCENSFEECINCTTEIDLDIGTHFENSTMTDFETQTRVLAKDNQDTESSMPAEAPNSDGPHCDNTDLLSSQLHTIDLFKRTQYTVENLGRLQAADEELSPLIQYLQQGILPASQKQCRRLMLESSDYVVIDGVLLKSRTAKSKRTQNMSHFQLVLPEVMIKTVKQLYHDSPMGGHSGIQDTLDRVREHYFFMKMGQKIADYVRSCTECQLRKQTQISKKQV